jgi:hypothetical protein
MALIIQPSRFRAHSLRVNGTVFGFLGGRCVRPLSPSRWLRVPIPVRFPPVSRSLCLTLCTDASSRDYPDLIGALPILITFLTLVTLPGGLHGRICGAYNRPFHVPFVHPLPASLSASSVPVPLPLPPYRIVFPCCLPPSLAGPPFAPTTAHTYTNYASFCFSRTRTVRYCYCYLRRLSVDFHTHSAGSQLEIAIFFILLCSHSTHAEKDNFAFSPSAQWLLSVHCGLSEFFQTFSGFRSFQSIVRYAN